MDNNRLQLIQKMAEMKEDVFIKKIIMPLLETYDFETIENRHGVYEKGIDILCIKKDELDELELLAIQVKRTKFSGRSSDNGNIYTISTQLSQCLTENIKLRDGTVRKADRAWFISPYMLNISALESSFNKYNQLISSKIKILDGNKVIDLLKRRAPDIIYELGDHYSVYLHNTIKELTLIQESSVFRLKDKIPILKHYINLDLDLLPDFISKLMSITSQCPADTTFKLPLRHINSWTDFNNICAKLFQISPMNVIENPINNVNDLLKDKLVQDDNIKATILLDSVGYIHNLQKTVKKEIGKLIKHIDNDNAGSHIKAFWNFYRQLYDIINHPASQELINRQPWKYSSKTNIRLNIAIDTLLDSGVNFQIIAEAGAGKTTLLRMLAYCEAIKENPRLPIFISLSTMSNFHNLSELIFNHCLKNKLCNNFEEFENLLNSGNLLILLDGLDEIASKFANVKGQIHELVSKYKKTQCFLSSRPWAVLESKNYFLNIKVLPFTEKQINDFFYTWFQRQPEQAEEIIDHLEQFEELRQIISTPLFATIFAVVKSMGGKLPRNLIELHEERLRLLLHDWDSVKGLKRDQYDSVDKRFLLRKLAYYMHLHVLKSLPLSRIYNLAIENIGAISDIESAESLINEMIQNNNVLFQNEDGQWAFGHLQYQEYLTALEVKENPEILLSEYILDGWWESVIKLYAVITRDITKLITDAYNKYNKTKTLIDEDGVLSTKLYHLLLLAPNTSNKAKGRVYSELNLYKAVHESFTTLTDTDILLGKGRPY